MDFKEYRRNTISKQATIAKAVFRVAMNNLEKTITDMNYDNFTVNLQDVYKCLNDTKYRFA